MPRQSFCPTIVDSHSIAPSAFVRLSPSAPGHIGVALGGIARYRRVRGQSSDYSKIAVLLMSENGPLRLAENLPK
jgi:hypothetical protein